ncbi:MAG: DUF262 domain-containing protein [Cryomorphaceae bacterium]|nr:DUF262 domain-containing protein [Cryomorphaceae bacterium]
MTNSTKQEFKVIAKTFCLKKEKSDDYENLLDGKKKYVVPIYQRPYSWNQKNVEKLLKDLRDSFQTPEGVIINEPLFIGTMQLGKPKDNNYEVVDGQQRLTTFFLLFQVLNKILNRNEDVSWFSTKVNNGEQQSSLDEAVQNYLNSDTHELFHNKFYNNINIIHEFIDALGDNDSDDGFDYEMFLNHIYSNVFFVIVETHAGLSKTIQIFNTINTTGMDLNGGDLFKIRMYEYLTENMKADSNVFNEISDLYQKLEKKSKDHKKSIGINDILRLYQYQTIAKFDIGKTNYSLSPTAFFDRMFDILLKIDTWPGFDPSKNYELNLEEIDALIESRFEWEQIESPSLEVIAAHHFIGWSRYSRYWILRVLFYHNFKNVDKAHQKLFDFLVLLSKVCQIYSIEYDKAINEIHSLMYDVNKAINEKSESLVFELLTKKINKRNESNRLKNRLNFNLTANQKRKDLICRISAILNEKDFPNKNHRDKIAARLFKRKEYPLDIEHIKSYNDQDVVNRGKIKEEWGSELNGLGNLVVLERKINQKIKNHQNVKDSNYKESELSIVRKLSGRANLWSKENAAKRRELECEKIWNYFFSNTKSK